MHWSSFYSLWNSSGRFQSIAHSRFSFSIVVAMLAIVNPIRAHQCTAGTKPSKPGIIQNRNTTPASCFSSLSSSFSFSSLSFPISLFLLPSLFRPHLRSYRPSFSWWLPRLVLLYLDIYNDNVDTFCPSRWKNPTKEMLDAFLPFSLGKHNCIGQSLAKMQRCIALLLGYVLNLTWK
jgi:hypothetical protein